MCTDISDKLLVIVQICWREFDFYNGYSESRRTLGVCETLDRAHEFIEEEAELWSPGFQFKWSDAFNYWHSYDRSDGTAYGTRYTILVVPKV